MKQEVCMSCQTALERPDPQPTDTKQPHPPRIGQAIYLLIGSLGLSLFLVSSLLHHQFGSGWDLVVGFLSNVASTFACVAVLFFLVDRYFQYNPEHTEHIEICDAQRHALAQTEDHCKEQKKLLDDSTRLLDRLDHRDVPVFMTRDSVYKSGIATLNSADWNKVRIFAPVGLWREDDWKDRWLHAIASYMQRQQQNGSPPTELWAVFGLPPSERGGRMRPDEDVRIDIDRFRSKIDIFKDLKNLKFHYCPPAHISVGFGVIVFENRDRATGGVSFGLCSRDNEEVVDAGVALSRNELFSIAKEWFDDRILGKSVEPFVLCNDDLPIDDTWPDILNKWYPRLYPSSQGTKC
jgi:hypothetical protein